MNRKIIVFFMVSVVVGSSIYTAQKLNFSLPDSINFYVNDFLIIPICLTISLFVLTHTKNDKNITIPLPIILGLSAFYSILFEYILPPTHNRYTADGIDVLMYFLGGLIFYVLQSRNKKSA